jgi:hypothetical protein
MLPHLSDGRDSHARLGAVVAGVWPAVATRREHCCDTRVPIDECAAGIVSELDAAGAMLIVPGDPMERAFNGVASWSAALYRQASKLGDFERYGREWYVWRGTGAGGPMPCMERVALDWSINEGWKR